MFLTARQLEALHRAAGANGSVVVPYRARLSPLAQDWLRAKKVILGYAEIDAPAAQSPAHPGGAGIVTQKPKAEAPSGPSVGSVLWWCDGPCGAVKAALVAQAKESDLRPLEQPADSRSLVPVIKQLAGEIKAGSVAAGVLVVQDAALATVFANRCPSLRAIVATSLNAVEQGVRLAAANVLVIEHPNKTLSQVRNLLSRFVRGRRELSEDVRRHLQDLAACE